MFVWWFVFWSLAKCFPTVTYRPLPFQGENSQNAGRKLFLKFLRIYVNLEQKTICCLVRSFNATYNLLEAFKIICLRLEKEQNFSLSRATCPNKENNELSSDIMLHQWHKYCGNSQILLRIMINSMTWKNYPTLLTCSRTWDYNGHRVMHKLIHNDILMYLRDKSPHLSGYS